MAFKMVFGKYKGKDITAVPRGYLRWLLGTGIDEPLRQVIEDVLAGREVTAEQLQGGTDDERIPQLMQETAQRRLKYSPEKQDSTG